MSVYKIRCNHTLCATQLHRILFPSSSQIPHAADSEPCVEVTSTVKTKTFSQSFRAIWTLSCYKQHLQETPLYYAKISIARLERQENLFRSQYAEKLCKLLVTRASVPKTMLGRCQSRNGTHLAKKGGLPCQSVMWLNPGHKLLILTQYPPGQPRHCESLTQNVEH